MVDLHSMRLRMHSLVVFRDLLKDPIIQRFDELLNAGSDSDFVNACAGFESSLFSKGDNWSEYLAHAVLHSENIAVRLKAVSKASPVIDAALARELELLDQEIDEGLKIFKASLE